MPEPVARRLGSAEEREAVEATYAVLESLPSEQRLPFSLRYIQGMELKEVASACGVSLATIKRRISKAERRFVARAANDPALSDWLQEGSRWNHP